MLLYFVSYWVIPFTGIILCWLFIHILCWYCQVLTLIINSQFCFSFLPCFQGFFTRCIHLCFVNFLPRCFPHLDFHSQLQFFFNVFKYFGLEPHNWSLDFLTCNFLFFFAIPYSKCLPFSRFLPLIESFLTSILFIKNFINYYYFYYYNYYDHLYYYYYFYSITV